MRIDAAGYNVQPLRIDDLFRRLGIDAAAYFLDRVSVDQDIRALRICGRNDLAISNQRGSHLTYSNPGFSRTRGRMFFVPSFPSASPFPPPPW